MILEEVLLSSFLPEAPVKFSRSFGNISQSRSKSFFELLPE
jgi:hypothetical protein